MNPFKNFDKVYCLNLLEREDRWNICLDNFNKYGIDNYERFDALRFVPDEPEKFSSKRIGQLGCIFSFCAMIDDAIKNNYKQVVFLEDDFEFIEPIRFNDKLQACLSELPQDWDMLYLGANVIDDFYEKPLTQYSDNLLKLNSGYALHSVCLSQKGLRAIKQLVGLDPLDFDFQLFYKIAPMYEAIDVFFAKDFQIAHNCFLPNELLSLQKPDFSSIEGSFFDYQALMMYRFNYFKNELTKG
jgi:GR25 family glycosyltransferase involved in LPS biosynthesis